MNLLGAIFSSLTETYLTLLKPLCGAASGDIGYLQAVGLNHVEMGQMGQFVGLPHRGRSIILEMFTWAQICSKHHSCPRVNYRKLTDGLIFQANYLSILDGHSQCQCNPGFVLEEPLHLNQLG